MSTTLPSATSGAEPPTAEPPTAEPADATSPEADAGSEGTPETDLADWADELTRDALQTIAEGITALAGFGVAAVSVARDPDTLQVMAVAGDEEARATLLGTLTPTVHLMSELADAEDWGFFRFLPAESLDPDTQAWGWVPDIERLEGDDAWDPMDLLVAPLFDESGQIRGIVSIDVPLDGRRPDAARRTLLNRYAEQAGRALEVAVQRESLREQVRLANAAREVIRDASRDLEISTLITEARPAILSGFRAAGLWIHTFDEDGSGQGAIYTDDGPKVDMPRHLVRLAEQAATASWAAQSVGIVSRGQVVNARVSPDEIDQILDFIEQIGVGSLLFVPMGAGQECLGSLVLSRGPEGPDWSETEAEVALEVGRDLGRAILNARAFERERDVVRGLQAIDRYKSQLIATLSHELKSPLTAILANVELIDRTVVDADLADVLSAVERGALRLVRVVENLLLLAKVGDPDMPLLAEPVDLCAQLKDLNRLNQAEAARRGVTIEIRGCGSEVSALGDRAELDLVLTNLLSNAIKYTPEGGRVAITVDHMHDEVVLTFRDEGIGISAADQTRLFQEFFRSSSPAVKAEPGTGLGLTIVQRIVARHHGRIDVESELGAGSTFRVYLPAA